MKRILCTSIALLILLTACTVPRSEQRFTRGDYVFVVSMSQVSGDTVSGKWELVCSCPSADESIFASDDIFAFCTVQVQIRERDSAGNVYTGQFPVAVCDGATGKTEITVTEEKGIYAGNTATFEVTCTLEKI